MGVVTMGGMAWNETVHVSGQPRRRVFVWAAVIAGAFFGFQIQAEGAVGGRVQFNRDVRPFLSDKCFACHGFDARKWIEEGARYEGHWAFEKPVKPVVPAGASNPVDAFLLERLKAEGVGYSAPATREAWIRRVTLALTGLPPKISDVDAFLKDDAGGAEERVVDRLLASARYGEQMARHWLDVARYGDTHGLHLDNERSVWPYRDWVIGAFNRNLPFDQFTVEQLAGDLLSGATPEQLVATGFNRCNVTTSEG